jgi:hypothetical protein
MIKGQKKRRKKYKKTKHIKNLRKGFFHFQKSFFGKKGQFLN